MSKLKSCYNVISMLRLSKTFYDRAVLSLRTGGKVGMAIRPIINPNNLKIEGWYAKDSVDKGSFVLPSGEIRDFITKGLVVNDHDSLTRPEDLVRMKNVIDLGFDLIGKTVYTESKNKLGKVVDYAVDEGFFIQKFYVNPPILKGLTGNQYLIGRSEIVEITDKKVIVADTSVRSNSAVPLRAEA